ncbi:MAG: hypothetical protein Q6373_008995 [Candidatus Sigynarchaeota archaeon]
MIIKACWLMHEPLGSYLIPLRVTNPDTKVSKTVWCIFDSGFTGYVSLDAGTIKDLHLKPAGKGRAHTITGSVDFETHSGMVEIIDEKQESITMLKRDEREVLQENTDGTGAEVIDPAVIPIQQFRHPLFGMRAIQQFSWLIVAEKKMLCLVDV